MQQTSARTIYRTMSAANAQHLSFAQSNFSKSGASGLYDRARPRYPAPAVQHITYLLTPSAPGLVVELGPGTGIFSRMLLAEGKGRIKKLLAVEPAEGMRQGFMNNLEGSGVEPPKSGIQVEVVDGTFDKIPAGDASVDLVVAAQAFHWSNDGVAAIKEIGRVLKPGGKVALIWNLESRKTQWVAQLRDTYEVVRNFFKLSDPLGRTILYRLGLWKAMFNSPEYLDAFSGHAEHTTYELPVEGTEELVVDRALSKSYVTNLAQEEKDKVVKEIRAIVKRGDGKIWIDEEKGTFEYPYETDLYVMTKKT
ncbi:hypothetical protein P7C70_g1537, partial [Phenoliferia sp. Uapishka_3]